MKAFVHGKYGPPEKVLKQVELEVPKPGTGQVRVKIFATTINDYDWSAVRGKPYLYRLFFGLFKPKRQIQGMELAGIIDAIGPEVKKWRIGDEVYGDISDYGFGSFAEFICINENAIRPKPKNLSFEEAASLPHASLLAYQALKDIGKISQGQKILINGGGGGVGMMGLQLSRLHNCEVTGVDSGGKLKTMSSLGFDYVIDYKTTDFTKNGIRYDLVLDCKSGKHPLSYLRSLKPGGIYVTVGGNVTTLLKLVMWGKLISAFSSKRLKILALKSNQGLEHISEMVETGKIKPAIDGPYPFEDIPRLVQYFGEGKHFGKIVVRLEY